MRMSPLRAASRAEGILSRIQRVSGTKGSAADLLLNTAELSVFTIALYLLSAIQNRESLGHPSVRRSPTEHG